MKTPMQQWQERSRAINEAYGRLLDRLWKCTKRGQITPQRHRKIATAILRQFMADLRDERALYVMVQDAADLRSVFRM